MNRSLIEPETNRSEVLAPPCPAMVAHPWHSIRPRETADGPVLAFIEIVPKSPLKFELDKSSGWLRVDRVQPFSSRPPAMYGLIPQTYCGVSVASRCMETTTHTEIVGDGDPMDIVVLSQDAPTQGGILVHARVIGGLRVVDNREADDKIIAVLEGDPIYGGFRRIGEVPAAILQRLIHYFTTYKQAPDHSPRKISIEQVYDHDEAEKVIALSFADYARKFLLEKPSL